MGVGGSHKNQKQKIMQKTADEKQFTGKKRYIGLMKIYSGLFILREMQNTTTPVCVIRSLAKKQQEHEPVQSFCTEIGKRDRAMLCESLYSFLTCVKSHTWAKSTTALCMGNPALQEWLSEMLYIFSWTPYDGPVKKDRANLYWHGTIFDIYI